MPRFLLILSLHGIEDTTEPISTISHCSHIPNRVTFFLQLALLKTASFRGNQQQKSLLHAVSAENSAGYRREKILEKPIQARKRKNLQ